MEHEQDVKGDWEQIAIISRARLFWLFLTSRGLGFVARNSFREFQPLICTLDRNKRNGQTE